MTAPAAEALLTVQRHLSRLLDVVSAPSALTALQLPPGWLLTDPLHMLDALVPDLPGGAWDASAENVVATAAAMAPAAHSAEVGFKRQPRRSSAGVVRTERPTRSRPSRSTPGRLVGPPERAAADATPYARVGEPPASVAVPASTLAATAPSEATRTDRPEPRDPQPRPAIRPLAGAPRRPPADVAVSAWVPPATAPSEATRPDRPEPLDPQPQPRLASSEVAPAGWQTPPGPAHRVRLIDDAASAAAVLNAHVAAQEEPPATGIATPARPNAVAVSSPRAPALAAGRGARAVTAFAPVSPPDRTGRSTPTAWPAAPAGQFDVDAVLDALADRLRLEVERAYGTAEA